EDGVKDWPLVTVLMAVYNEEKVIEEKLRSLLGVDYPKAKYQIYIGSDRSSDQTNAIIERYAAKHTFIHFYPFSQRQGKPGVINSLVEALSKRHSPNANQVYLMTDASVMLEVDCIRQMVRHFKHPEIMMVDSRMVSTGLKTAGISRSESQYVSSELRIKYREGLLWGKMIGPFGGCYALRSTHYHPVPTNFLVDDFYITMKAFEQGGLAIHEPKAVCFEAVSHDIREEYRRKSRISAGNFQNLRTFRHCLRLPFDALGFAFFSHKVLRWLGPFFIIFATLASGGLWALGHPFYAYVFGLILSGLILVPLLDYMCRLGSIHWLLLRNLSYFIIMNVALLAGYVRYRKGIKSGTWQPTKRE
ncbi:MAG: glycosyltransferase, partial [Bacteroidota bacterium]